MDRIRAEEDEKERLKAEKRARSAEKKKVIKCIFMCICGILPEKNSSLLFCSNNYSIIIIFILAEQG